jgi:uncharacterized RDD family membrane protein YckC
VLLFGVVMVAGLVYGLATGQHDAMLGRQGLQALLFVVLGTYFTWFWSRGGQTLAMKTWHIRVVRADGAPATPMQCLARYLLAWLWFVPALVSLWLAGSPSLGVVAAVLAAGVLGYATLTFLQPERQFWHDAACGTRLVTWRTAPSVGRPAQFP